MNKKKNVICRYCRVENNGQSFNDCEECSGLNGDKYKQCEMIHEMIELLEQNQYEIPYPDFLLSCLKKTGKEKINRLAENAWQTDSRDLIIAIIYSLKLSQNIKRGQSKIIVLELKEEFCVSASTIHTAKRNYKKEAKRIVRNLECGKNNKNYESYRNAQWFADMYKYYAKLPVEQQCQKLFLLQNIDN